MHALASVASINPATWFTAVLAKIRHRWRVHPSDNPTPLESKRSLSRRTSAVLLMVVAALIATGMRIVRAETVSLNREHGAFVLPVVINNQITRSFMLDSGASDVTIPADVISALTRSGSISTADFLGSQEYRLADGSVTRTRRVRIRSLRVGSVELRDVVVSVVPHAGVLLLGQSFLGRLQSWTIDNQRHLFVINQSPTDHPAASAVARPDDSPKAGNWSSVGTSTDGLQRLYVDSSTVRISGGIPRAWFKTLYSRHTVKGFGQTHKWMIAVLARDAFNCEEDTGRTEEATEYYDDGTKYVVPAADLGASWTPVRPGTGLDYEMGVLCKQPGARAPRQLTNNR
jgi:clan AA aspartic protease (TIGR02281 family)